MQTKLGIVAGGGDLPAVLIEACLATERPCHVLALEGHADPGKIGTVVSQDWVRPGAAGKALDILHAANVVELVFAGHVRRPSLQELRPDLRAAKFLAKGILNGGDDRLLASVVRELEEKEGFKVVGPDVLLGDLLTPSGTFGRCEPNADDWADIRRGVEVVRALGSQDVGQTAVVQQGVVLGIEAAEGTDGLIRRCGGLRRPGGGGVVVKLSKPGQDRRVDMPTVGVATIREAAVAGLVGLVVEAGASLVLGRERVTQEADTRGLFVHGIVVDERSA